MRLRRRVPEDATCLALAVLFLSSVGCGDRDRTEDVPSLRTQSSTPEARQAGGDRFAAADADSLLFELESTIRQRPDDPRLASRYRQACVLGGEYDRSLHFFEQLAAEQPAIKNVRLQLAAAYVDKIPTCGGIAAIAAQGSLARQALDQLAILRRADPAYWPAVYSSAVNHLHWPRALRHTDDAIRDFQACIALQTERGATRHAYYARSYVGLGDALVKSGDFAAAREAWQTGQRFFPRDPDLQRRLEFQRATEAAAFVREVRSLRQQIDTDLSFLAPPRP